MPPCRCALHGVAVFTTTWCVTSMLGECLWLFGWENLICIKVTDEGFQNGVSTQANPINTVWPWTRARVSMGVNQTQGKRGIKAGKVFQKKASLKFSFKGNEIIWMKHTSRWVKSSHSLEPRSAVQSVLGGLGGGFSVHIYQKGHQERPKFVKTY